MRSLIIGAFLLATAATPAFAANLITNGDFTAGTSGWTTTNSTHYVDASGFREGAVGVTDFLSQTFTDVAGSLLTVAFDFASDDSSSYQFVQFNGATVAGSLVSGATAMTHYSFALGTATGSDTLTFGGRNDPSYNTLNHVAVDGAATVPEPASWGLMIVGFGMIGVVSRRRAVVLAG